MGKNNSEDEILNRMDYELGKFKRYMNREMNRASMRQLKRRTDSVLEEYNGTRQSNNRISHGNSPQSSRLKRPQMPSSKRPQTSSQKGFQNYKRVNPGKPVKEMKSVTSQKQNPTNKKLRRVLYSLGAVGFIASSIFTYNLGKNVPDTPLLAVNGYITQDMRNSNPELTDAIQRYSELITLGNSEGRLCEASRAELFHLVTTEIIPNSQSVVTYYDSLVKEKIASSLGLGQDTSSIDISIDNNEQIVIQRILDNNTRQTFDISSFKNTSVYDALKNLEYLTANYLFTNSPSTFHDTKDLNINKDNVIEYVNTIIGMVNHSGELDKSVLRYDDGRFSEIKIQYEKEVAHSDGPEL